MARPRLEQVLAVHRKLFLERHVNLYMSRIMLLLGLASVTRAHPGDTALKRIAVPGRVTISPPPGPKVTLHLPKTMNYYESDAVRRGVTFEELAWPLFLEVAFVRGVSWFVPTGENSEFLRREHKIYQRLAGYARAFGQHAHAHVVSSIALEIEKGFRDAQP